MSEPLRRAAWEAALARAGRPALYLDFDGTLAPTADHPDDAALLPAARAALERLAGRARIAIISGRALADLRRRVGLPLIYAGNHGLEIQAPGLAFVEPRAEAAAGPLRQLCGCLAARLAGIPGVIVENKRLTASVHYRRVPAARVADVAAAVKTAVAAFPQFAIAGGNMVLNIRPGIAWDKGSAACWIQQRCGQPGDWILCAGDDLTDEDLFSAFSDALTVAVGCAYHTRARWCVPDPAALAKLLSHLAPEGGL